MNFQNLLKVEKPKFYLGKAFRESMKVASIKRSSKLKGIKLERSRTIELKKLEISTKILIQDMNNIIKSFPSYEELALFYQELVDIVINSRKLKKSLASIQWIKNKIKELHKKYSYKIKRASSINEINKLRKEYYGRISSLLERRKKDFELLENSRKKMKGFPAIKTNFKTICIAGLPNVGKSTLLTNITTANPEINIYPFTTKGLMLGYVGKKIQVIDTPGTFGKTIKKMNYIEQQAFLALKYLAKKIIFVIDLSESCGYSIKLQEKLLKELIKSFENKKIIIFFSKNDLINIKKISEFKKKYNQYETYSEAKVLKKFLIKN